MASARPGEPLPLLPESLQPEPCIIGSENGPQGDGDVVARCMTLLHTNAQHLIVHIADLTEIQKTIISNVLSQSPSVRRIDVLGRCRNTILIGDQGVAPVALPDITSLLGPLLVGISAHTSVQELEIRDLTIDSRTLNTLALLLKTPTCRLAKLMMRECIEACTNADAVGFAEACQVNGSVQELLVQGRNIPLLCGALAANPATSLVHHLPLTVATLVLTESEYIHRDLHQSWLAIGLRDVSFGDCTLLVDAVRRGNALRELIVRRNHLEHDVALLFSEMIQGLDSLQAVKIEGVMLKAASCLSLVQAVQSNSSIETIVMKPRLSCTRDSMQFADAMGRMLESSPHVVHLDVGCIDGILQLTSGLQQSRTLRSLTLRGDHRQAPLLWKILIDRGFRQNTSLDCLDLELPVTDEVSRPLASYIRNANNLRTIKLNFRRLEGNYWPVVIRALALNPFLEEVRLASGFGSMNSLLCANMEDELASVMPKLWKVRSLDTSMGAWDMMATASHMSLLSLNMSLTAIVCPLIARTNEEEAMKQAALCRIVNRNEGLSGVDYGVELPPFLWPLMIEMALRNEHVGPSLVFRLLSKRPGEIKTRGSSKAPPTKKARLE